jgi:hypothetical protein
MVVLHFDMHGEDIVEHINGKWHMFTIKYGEKKNILEHTNAKCQLCKVLVIL